MHLAEIADQHYDWLSRMGWLNTTPLEDLALIASEVGEAVNECRGDTPSSHLGEELADIILRTVGMATHHGIDITKAVGIKMAVNEQRGTRGRLK